MTKSKKQIFFIITLLIIIISTLLLYKHFIYDKKSNLNSKDVLKTYQEISIMASGDMLYHDLVYMSAKTSDGYDFSDNYEMIKPLIASADLAIGDFEGTISQDFKLAGYPLFNAPPEVVKAIKEAGYDVISLAHNHILDSRLKGALDTKKLFEENGIDTIGVKTYPDEKILVKDIKGVKIAIVGFSYGYNGMENTLTKDEYDNHMMDLNPEKVKETLQEAEKLADITVVMPQMGVEYSLSPTKEQIKMYHDMIDWGADIIFGGHPHVLEPTETLEHNGKKKFIIYSMGNLLSNQRLETLDNIWTERGVIMEVRIKRNSDKQGDIDITKLIPHPTWVSKTPKNESINGIALYKYQTLLAESYISGGKYHNTLDSESQSRIETAYNEILELLNIDASLK